MGHGDSSSRTPTMNDRTTQAEGDLLQSEPDAMTARTEDIAAHPEHHPALQASGLLDRPAHPRFGDVAELAAELLAVPYAFITVLHSGRCEVAAAAGASRPLAAQDDQCLCRQAVDSDGVILLDDTSDLPAADARRSHTPMPIGAWAGHPLRTDSGHVLGTLCVADDHPRTWTELDGKALTVLAASISRQMARPTIPEEDAPRLLRAADALARLAQALSRATSTDEIGRVIIEHLPAVAGCDMINLGLVTDEGASVVVHHPSAMDPGMRSRYTRLPLAFPSPLTEAIRDANEVWIVDAEARRREHPDLVDDTLTAGLTTTAALPVRDLDGAALGAIGLGWADRTEPSDELLRHLRTVVNLCSQSIRRAQFTGAQTGLVNFVREHLLPPVEPVEDLELAVRYLPANNHLGIGGDWYDVVHNCEGRVTLVVGDVAGHGVEATAQMVSTQSVLNTLLRVDWPAGDLLSEANGLLDRFGSFFATATVLIVDLNEEQVGHLSAGHPYPMIRTPDGKVQVIHGGRRPALGLEAPGVEPEWLPFPAGSTLVAYTDGLIERRDESIDDGIERLAARLRENVGLDAERTADDLIAHLLDDSRGDDTALVVLQTAG